MSLWIPTLDCYSVTLLQISGDRRFCELDFLIIWILDKILTLGLDVCCKIKVNNRIFIDGDTWLLMTPVLRKTSFVSLNRSNEVSD